MSKKLVMQRSTPNNQFMSLGMYQQMKALGYVDVGVQERCPRNKQTKKFGSNRNKPKQDLFRVCFGLFRETKKKKFLFVSVFRTYIETTETNRSVS